MSLTQPPTAELELRALALTAEHGPRFFEVPWLDAMFRQIFLEEVQPLNPRTVTGRIPKKHNP